MGAGDILKIAAEIKRTSLEGARKRFGALSGVDEESTDVKNISQEESVGISLIEELKKIHSAPREERKQKLVEFKEKMVEQKKGIAEIQKKLFDDVKKNPDASIKEYMNSIQDMFDSYAISSNQRTAFEKGLAAYVKTHEAIRENTKDCVVDKEANKIDGLMLYEKLFNQKPIGKIEVILRPAMIYIRIENRDDYVVALDRGRDNAVTDEARKKVNRLNGSLLKNFKIEGLECAIALENARDGVFSVSLDRETLEHEEQHAFNEIIQQGYNAEKEKYENGNYELHNVKIENRVKDEISAYFKNGRPPEDILETLLKPDTIYRYGFDYKGGDNDKSEFSREYVDLVRDGVSAYSHLLASGYSVDDVQGLLFIEPLSSWSKVAERITGGKVVKIESFDPQEGKLLDVLDGARNNFAKTEYNDRTRMNRIRKALNMSLDGNEENPNIESARKPYEDALRKYMAYQVDKLQTSGFEGADLEGRVKELYSFFNLQEATEYYDARTQAKMAYLASEKGSDGSDKGFVEKSWDFARLKSTQVSEWYSKKVPTSVKLALAAATFIPGASTFALGKRTWGAFMLVAAGGMQLDKLAQFKDAMSDKLERNKEFKNISAENGGVDFEKLKDLLGGKIDEMDKRLNEKNLRSGANKFIAFSGALFLGGSVFKGAMDLAEGKTVASTNVLGKLFSHKAEVSAPAGGHGIASTFDKANVDSRESAVFDKNNVYAPDSATPTADSFEHLKGGPADIADKLHASTNIAEALPASASTESLTIEKGSSIEKTLIDHIKKIHPDMKNPGAAAHRMWLDYMHDNKAQIVKSVGDGEYQKMLKDGMVNVKPGTTLILDEQNPLKIRLHDIEGKISHLNVAHSVQPAVIELPAAAEATLLEPTAVEALVANDALPYNPEHDYQKLETEMGVEKSIDSLKVDYAQAADDALRNPAGDGPSLEQYERMGKIDNLTKESSTLLNAMRAEDLPWSSTTEVGALLEKGAGTKQILGAYLNKITEGSSDKLAFWNEIKNKPFGEVEFGNNAKGIAKTIAEFQRAVGDKYADQIYPKKDFTGNMTEKTGVWLARITKLALQVKK